MEKEKIKEIYSYFLNEFKNQEVAIELTKEWGLFERTEQINKSHKEIQEKKQTDLATIKQKDFLKNLGFEGDMDKITKLEAQQLIKDLLTQQDGIY